jgi:hypothetical protein
MRRSADNSAEADALRERNARTAICRRTAPSACVPVSADERIHAVAITRLTRRGRVVPPSAHRPQNASVRARPCVKDCALGGQGSEVELSLAVGLDRRLRCGIGALPCAASRCPMSVPLEARVKLLDPLENVIGRLLALVACRL